MAPAAQVVTFRPQETSTEPLMLGHPRAAQVAILAADSALGAAVLTRGTLVFKLDLLGGGLWPMPLSLRVDRIFVSMTIPEGAQAADVRAAIEQELPDDYALLSHVTDECLVATVIRMFEAKTVAVACTSLDARQRVVRAQSARAETSFVLRGCAKGNGALELTVNGAGLRLVPARGDAPLTTALRLRELLSPDYAVMVTVPSEPWGDVSVTVLPH